MKKSVQKRARHRAVRNMRRALMVGTGLLAMSEAAFAQSAACQGSALSCTIPSGSFNQPLLLRSGSTAAVTFTNNGNFAVTTPQSASFLGVIESLANGLSGATSSNNDAGSAQSGGTISFTNNGIVTHTISPLINAPSVANTVYGASIGGNGGNYTNNDAKHDGGSAGNAGAAVMSNLGAITVGPGPSANAPTILVSGAALLVDSYGGNGGNVTSMGPDSNGNPTYGTQNGTPGGAGGNASLTNSGAITVSLGQPLFGLGYWGAAARSLGGNGGTGNNGQVGGSAGTANVFNSADISVVVRSGSIPTDSYVQGATPGFFALHARSQGGVGNMSVNSGNNGGSGGNAVSAGITAGNAGQPLTITLNATPASLSVTPVTSAAVAALSLGGNGGAGYDSSRGGFGGGAGPSLVTLNPGVSVTASGQQVIGVLSLAQGGVGGSSGVGQNNSRGGDGGSAGNSSSSTPSASITLDNANVSTTGQSAPALMAASVGGAGGAGIGYTQTFGLASAGGMGGGGGNTGPVSITTTGGVISTSGAQSIAVLALTQGGAGGVGGSVNAAEGTSGSGGSGGQSAPITVTINAGTQIITTGAGTIGGAGSHGILASSAGGVGGQAGAINVELGGASGVGGPGGGGYNVTVTLAAGSSVRTSGDASFGVVARSVGGGGGSGNTSYDSGGIATTAPDGGNGGNSGTVRITSGAQVTTTGNNAHGLVAQSITGTGGDGGPGAGIIYAPSGSGGTSGFTGSATVTNTGSITTSGIAAMGIQAQSIGGDSGSAGSVDGSIITVGGAGGVAADGNFATVTHSGSIVTAGQGSIGILAQSIGGGGGNGGDARGVLGSVGGSGAGGGAGDTTTVTLNGSVSTQGQLAHGVVAQSIGGGGGNGGNSSAVSGVAAFSLGGTGGGGGNGGLLQVNGTGGSISTFGSNAIGLVGQSIGGGGGTGGSAYALSVGADFSAAAAIGGSGGKGGAAGTASELFAVTAQLSGITISTGQGVRAGTNTNPVDSHGIVLQAIGGGGGAGGAAAAAAVAVTIPSPETSRAYSAALTYSMGGSGATGGSAAGVSFVLDGASRVTTQGQGSHGVLLQSIGGGGGAGGDSSAMATTIGYGRAATASGSNNFSLTTSVSVGGNSAGGGNGGQVSAFVNAGTITTYGDFANAFVGQSIGGGGGNGGVGSSTTQSFGSTRSASLSIGLGGTGGVGGLGGSVAATLAAPAVLQTYGAGSVGFLLQSIGGGGGTSQGSTVNLGAAYSAENNTTYTANASVSVGGTGGAGGGSQSINADIQGTIRTSGGDASGVVLQAIGGGGGLGGTAGADASADNPISTLTGLRSQLTDKVEGNITQGYSAQLSVGGRGGVAGQGAFIGYTQSGSITTLGDWSHGAVLQSIGGGGGMGGVATSNSSGSSFWATLALGGDGGSAGNGGQVRLQFSPGSSISTGVTGTSGFAAFGVLAQSIGGGGGTAADGSAKSSGRISLGAGVGGTGGGGGNAADVTAQGTVNIVTRGAVAVGLALQSIGGGGGLAGSGSSLSYSLPDGSGTSIMTLGARGGATGDAGQIIISDATFNIQTSGAHAHGILAQSIGGGGGFGFNAFTNSYSNSTDNGSSLSQFLGGGSQINIALTGGSIQTSGFGAHGIVAQSIGGGGGIAGLPSSAGANLTTNTFRTPIDFAPGGVGGPVTIMSSSPITTRGDFAYGILAQSIGGSGGLTANGNQVVAGATVAFAPAGFSSYAQSVRVTQSAPISATGANSVGIFGQSRGAGGDGQVYVTVQAPVQGGSGPQGVGVWVDSGNWANQVQISAGGSLSALSGNALLMSGGNALNQGTVTGNVTIGNGGTFTNQGTHNLGTTAAVGEYVNTGVMNVGSHLPYGVTAISGNFTQGRTGRIVVDADFTGRRSDLLVVAGSANLDGRVRPRLTSVLPDVELPFLVVNGPIIGSVRWRAVGDLQLCRSTARGTPSRWPPMRISRRPATTSTATWRPSRPSASGLGCGRRRPRPALRAARQYGRIRGARAPTARPCGRSRPIPAWRPARAWPPARATSPMPR
jgi:hypothetical protein